VDVQTTGINPDQRRIIELGVCLFEYDRQNGRTAAPGSSERRSCSADRFLYAPYWPLPSGTIIGQVAFRYISWNVLFSAMSLALGALSSALPVAVLGTGAAVAVCFSPEEYRIGADLTQSPETRDGLRQSLLKYCQRDTLALARVHQWLTQER
jgi:DNA polymerase III epsilon subunit-like protein